MTKEQGLTTPDLYAQTDVPILDRGDLLGRFLTPQRVETYYDRAHPEARQSILNLASEAIGRLRFPDMRSFARGILRGLATEDEYWTQDRRDICLDLLDLVNLAKIKPTSLMRDYLDAVARQTSKSDVYGTIDSLLDSGIKLAPYFPAGARTREIIQDAWGDIAINFPADDIEFIDKK